MKNLKTLLFLFTLTFSLTSCVQEDAPSIPDIDSIWMSKSLVVGVESNDDVTLRLDFREEGNYILEVIYVESDQKEVYEGSLIHVNANHPGWMEFVTDDGTTLKTWAITVLDDFIMTVSAQPFFGDFEENCTITFLRTE